MLLRNRTNKLLGIVTTIVSLLLATSASFAEQIPICADPPNQEPLTSGALRTIGVRRGVITSKELQLFLQGKNQVIVNNKIGYAFERFNKENHPLFI